MVLPSTLSKRGVELASLPDLRSKYDVIAGNLYDPDTNPTGFINAGVAENFAMLPDIAAFCSNIAIPQQEFSYNEGPWGTKRLREAMAKHMMRHFNPIEPIDPANIIFSNGLGSMCEMLGFTICDAGDAVLYTSPIYQSFKMDFALKAKGKPIFVDFGHTSPFSPEAVNQYEAAILKAELEGTRVRALMLCNPHNPLGQCYPKDSIIALMKLCDKYKLHLLCDEIYACSVYEVEDKATEPFTSVLSFDYSKYIDKDLVHVLYGFSKDFGAGGLRQGCILSKNQDLLKAIASITLFAWSGGPSDFISIKILEDEEWVDNFMDVARKRLASRNLLVRKTLDAAGIDFHRGANAGFFIWMDLRKFLPKHGKGWEKEKFLKELFSSHGLFLTAGETMNAPEPGFFRIIFSQEERTLMEALRRMLAALSIKVKV